MAFGSPTVFEPGCAQCYLPRWSMSKLFYGGNDQSIADNAVQEIFRPDPDNKAEVVVLWGAQPSVSQTAESGRGMAELRAKGVKTIVVDPNFSPDAVKADVWLPVRPATDTGLLLCWFRYIFENKLYDEQFTKYWTNLDVYKRQLSGAAWTAPAFADVRKADVVYGQTVDARGLAVAQCPSIDAEYAMVMGADGTVYFERNAQSPTQIASITKIMTGVVALDAVEDGLLSLDSPVTVSAAAAAVGESSAGLQEGDVMNLDAALKALLVPSGNDAAVAIAETIGALMEPGTSDPEAVFVNAMNAKAQELGCTDTVYDLSLIHI